MKGRFFTLILGLCLVATSAMAQDKDEPKKADITGSIPVNIYTSGYNITLPGVDMDLSKNGVNGSGGDTTINCATKIPAVEMLKGAGQIHAVNKYTQLATTQAAFNYLTVMGIYNGTVAEPSFNKNGSLASWTNSQYTPGYWGTQNAIVDMYSNNSWLMFGMGGLGGGMNGGWGSWGGYQSASMFPRWG